MNILSIFFSCTTLSDTFKHSTKTFPDCEEPVSSPGMFINALPTSNVDFIHHSNPSDYADETASNFDPFRGSFGAGLVAADFDRDQAIDLFFIQEEGDNKLYWGNGNGTFDAASSQTSQEIAREDVPGISANTADFNGDGLLDLLVLGYNDIALYQNMGDRTFIEKSQEFGLKPTEGYPGGASWGDYDGDGDLDLFVCSYGLPELAEEDDTEGPLVLPSFLYRNDGITFTDRSHELPFVEKKEGACMQGAFRDLDHDGDLDLLQVNDFGPWRGMTHFWENMGPSEEGWTWKNRYSDSGAGTLDFPMGSIFRDLNGDQKPDLWLSGIGKTNILQYLGNWEWIAVAETWGRGISNLESDVSWSVLDIDLDGDGDPGIYIGYGPHLAEEPPESWNEIYEADQPDRFLLNQAEYGEEPQFTVDNSVFPFPLIGNARGAATVDINNDGVPDLITSNLQGSPSILLGACTQNNRLVIRIRDNTSMNTFGIGSTVTVQTSERIQTQEMSAGGRGTFSGEEPALFFGVGSAENIKKIIITWPDGYIQEIQKACAHCQITLERER